MNREAIFKAVYDALMTKHVSKGGVFKTITRRPKLWTEIADTDKPALVIVQEGDSYAYQSERTPPKVTLNAKLLIYTATPSDSSAIPASTMNALKDAVDAALAYDYNAVNNLGGLVSHCRIEGDNPMDDGSLSDGQGVAVISLKMLTTI